MNTETETEISSFAGLTVRVGKGQTQQEALEAAFPNSNVQLCHEGNAWIGNTSSPSSLDGHYYNLVPTGTDGEFTLEVE